jgi:hypothetical protein
MNVELTPLEASWSYHSRYGQLMRPAYADKIEKKQEISKVLVQLCRITSA